MKLSRSLVALSLVVALMLLATGATLARSSSDSSMRATGAATSAKRASVIMWNQAKRYAGSIKTVKGPVKGIKYASSSTGRPTFISIGKNYPNRSRFTVVIWGKYRAAFPANLGAYYRGKTVLATGKIKMYQGSAQMFVRSPSKLRVAQ
jgi:guanyl-specific ribonuclease Sa